jgi:hypothetical protein
MASLGCSQSTVVTEQLEDVSQFVYGVFGDRIRVEMGYVITYYSQFIEALDEGSAI